MFSRIHDFAGRSLLTLFLIKPLIDLTWVIAIPVAGGVRSPMHIFAALAFPYFLLFRFRPTPITPPFLRTFEVFLGLHVVAMFVGFATNDRLTMLMVADFMLRIGNSYLIYYCAFFAAVRYRYRDVTPFVKAIVLGATLPVLANAIAVPLDLDFGVYQPGISGEELKFRERGLYYDAGVLANAAFFHLVFCIFWLHLAKSKHNILFIGTLLGLIMIDLYLISTTQSRSFIIQLAIFGFLYLLLFQKRWGKILAPIVTAGILGLAVVLFDIDPADLFVRFESDESALSGEADVGINASGEVSFGSLEGLGSNRGALWADALTRIFKRDGLVILFGNFSGSVSHSDYIDVLARSGLISVPVYLTLIFGLLLRSWRATRVATNSHDRTIAFMAFVLLTCYAAYSLPFRPLNYTTTSWYMWTIIAFAMARMRLAPLEAAAAAKDRLAAEADRDPEPPASNYDDEDTVPERSIRASSIRGAR